ncbi:hypothetical protein GN958_ATG02298 [Phytophthora infestans]|uniref:Uncharacterized protein n=1 Tax=Phytophthora infestans TaxID=4787 RepID=A0A8S9V8G8_PHYIN|nr:hypothetical protein GN958_ATG02298 [Phytophthora infestans]
MHELRRQGIIYQHLPSRNSISFLLNETEPSTDVAHVFQQSTTRVYDPELKRTREALPVTA